MRLRNMGLVVVTAGLIAFGCVVAGSAVGADSTPERIVSKRIRILSPDRYKELHAAWKAYTEAHPGDPMGWTELAKAARYDGVACKDFIQHAERAFQLNPDYAEACATLGSNKWHTWCGAEAENPIEAIRLLERAIELDPTLDEPHYSLWVLHLSAGRHEAAGRHLEALLDGGHLPAPLVDLAYNMLVGVEPNGIILTNGDNDTYPPLALQAARGVRTDVAIVNLSMLNLAWYRQQLKSGPHDIPVPLLEDQAGRQSPAALKGLIANLKEDGWTRPLYAACTLNLKYHTIPNKLSLEGVVYRVLGGRGEGKEINGEQLAHNLDERYRLDSATSFAVDWNEWSALRPLMLNYAGAWTQRAIIEAEAGDLRGARVQMERALELCAFHGSVEATGGLIDEWGKWDPESPDLARWKKKLGH